MGKPLHILVNGESREVDDGTSIPQLVAALELKPQQIAVELNHEVVRRAQWETTILRDGDKIEIVHFVGGGGAEEQEPGAGAGCRSRSRKQETIRREWCSTRTETG